MPQGLVQSPNVWLVGDVEHADFAEAVALLRATANVGPGLPEVVVVAQSRPGVMGRPEWMLLRRSAPLSGYVSLVGSWCEGETRTGRPVVDVERLYWYEFPAWWRRQLIVRAAGSCPDWVRRGEGRLPPLQKTLSGQCVAISAERWDTATAIADAIKEAGGDSIWMRSGSESLDGVTAGVWDGGQLGTAEHTHLSAFCSNLARQHSPVVALLDFPRRDRAAAADCAGAATVLGKPWSNADLVATLQQSLLPDAVTIDAA